MIARLLLAAATILMLTGTASAQEIRRCPAQLPAPVAGKRDAIIAAAQARDWTALQQLAGPGEFTYSFGEEGDAVAYWRQSVQEGIDIPRLLARVFAMGCAVAADTGSYFFPAAAEIEWRKLTAPERKALQDLYGARLDDWYMEGRENGYYVGWRGVIEKDGAWSAFVAGD